MKNLGLFIAILIPGLSFAGNGGGTMSAARMLVQQSGGGGGVLGSSEIVFHLEQTDKSVRFAYGQLVDNQWQVQNVEVLKSDLEYDPEVIKALQASNKMKTWRAVK